MVTYYYYLTAVEPPIAVGLVQGDGYLLTFSIPDYPNDVWTGQLVFTRSGSMIASKAAVPIVGDPAGWNVPLDPATSNLLTPGACSMFMVMDGDIPYGDPIITFIVSFTPSDVNVAQNKFTLNGHGLVFGNKIRFVTSVGSVLPSPFVIGTDYWVISAATNSFQLALTEAGLPIVITDAGTGTNDINRVDPPATAHQHVSLFVGNITIIPNPTGTYTPSSPAQEMLVAVNATITKVLSQPEQSASFNGQTYTLHNIRDLYNIRNELLTQVGGELRSLGLVTKPAARIIQNRFV